MDVTVCSTGHLYQALAKSFTHTDPCINPAANLCARMCILHLASPALLTLLVHRKLNQPTGGLLDQQRKQRRVRRYTCMPFQAVVQCWCRGSGCPTIWRRDLTGVASQVLSRGPEDEAKGQRTRSSVRSLAKTAP